MSTRTRKIGRGGSRGGKSGKAPLAIAEDDLVEISQKRTKAKTSKKKQKEVVSSSDDEELEEQELEELEEQEEEEERPKKKKKTKKSNSKIKKKVSILMVSFKYHIPDENHMFHALHNKTGSECVQMIMELTKDFNPEEVSVFPCCVLDILIY
jgi:superfamily II DNA/RNA helicase